MATKTEKHTVYLGIKQWESLRTLAYLRVDGIETIGAHIRVAVDKYLKKKNPLKNANSGSVPPVVGQATKRSSKLSRA